MESLTTTCKNPPNFLATVWGAIGFKENKIMCGGKQNGTESNRCYSLENNEWVSSDSMNSKRAYAAAVRLQGGKTLVTGGSSLNSSEMLTEGGWESKIPALPVTIVFHCMVTVNSTTVMVIGGEQNGQFSGNTFYFTFGEEGWTEGPKLKKERKYHSCRKIKRDKDNKGMSIIVVGGLYESTYLSSVEMLDEGSNEWKTGPELPFGIGYSQMVEDQNGGVILIGGYSLSRRYLDTLYQLPHGGQEVVWTKMEQKLKTGRERHTAFLVQDKIVECF
jgi:N-acetylneuraminic acid mutarotase